MVCQKTQLATARYKKTGGGYSGAKSSSNSLSKWSKQNGVLQTDHHRRASVTYQMLHGSPYLPAEKAATNRAKAKGNRSGKQFVKQPKSLQLKRRGLHNAYICTNKHVE